MKTNKDLLDISKSLSEISNNIENIFGACDILSTVQDSIWDLILKEYKIEKNNEIILNSLFKFENGEITKKVLLKKLNKWKTTSLK